MNQTIKTLFHRKIKWTLTLAAAGCLWGSSLIAGTLTWNWSFSGSADNGSGTFTTEDTTSTANGYTGYLITAMTGTWDNQTITSLLPVGTAAPLGGTTDNLLGSAKPQLDKYGIKFATATATNFIVYTSGIYIGAKSSGTFTATLVQPVLTPVISSITLFDTNVLLTATNGQSGKTYITLTSPDLSQWTPVATNVLNTDGSFSITVTNGFNSNVSSAFYRLQIQ